ncbi:MAG: hypothetical protein F6K47_22645 [Symploca sp. SIO2E6]|nr:hypothetical protein [Symploca sp. SIO2E6]
MVQSLQVKDITLRYLIKSFGIQLIENDEFFPEWQDNLPEISDFQKRQLDQVKAGFINLQSYPQFSENLVRMAVLDPLLFNSNCQAGRNSTVTVGACCKLPNVSWQRQWPLQRNSSSSP